ncbi:MAG: hypothetical protein CMO80_25200 [Verrucomicrobiales bacterium]|nr:hypothetical protein [Verrucomicrobiales bacterium]
MKMQATDKGKPDALLNKSPQCGVCRTDYFQTMRSGLESNTLRLLPTVPSTVRLMYLWQLQMYVFELGLLVSSMKSLNQMRMLLRPSASSYEQRRAAVELRTHACDVMMDRLEIADEDELRHVYDLVNAVME